MNFYAFSALVICVSCVASGAIVLWKNPRGRKNLAFLPNCVSAFSWAFFYYFWQMSTNEKDALFYIRLCVAGAAMIPVSNFYSILVILEAETPRRKVFLNIFLVVTIILLIFSPTKYFIPRVEPRGGFPYWPVPGPTMHVHFLNLFIPSLWVLYLIWEKGQKATPLLKNKLKWVLATIIVGYAGGMTNNFLWYNIPVMPKGTALASLTVIGIAATFFRPAVVDFNYFLKKTSLSLLYAGLTSLSVILVLLPFHSKLPLTGIIIISTYLGILIYPLIKKLVFVISERLSGGNGASSRLIKASREKIRESTYTYTELARNIVDMVLATLPVEAAAVYFFDIAKKEFYLCAQKGMKKVQAADLRYNRSALAVGLMDPLIVNIEHDQKLVNLEALLNETDSANIVPLVDTMHRLEGELCAPFIFGGKLRGFLIVGRKKENNLFNEEELEVVLSYSQMGTDVMHTIMAMETELNHTALYSHDINHDIRSIAQTLEFLRSPMAKGQGEEKIQLLLERAEKVAGKLYESFQMNRDRSALIMKSIRGDYEKKPLKPSDIVTASSRKFALQAEEAHVEYILNVEPAAQPIQANELDLTRVTDNLISNGLRHLPATGGRLEITGRNEGAQYEIVVQDNGEGIAPEDLDHIWEVGWQAKEGKKGSAGFGLAIVKEIVQIHGGTIKAISQGKGTGVKFIITL